jgi:enoyl-CoA hydratase/carnithine racemase
MADEVTIEEDGPLLLIGVNRPDAHKLWNLELIQAVCRACKRLADASSAGLVNEVVPKAGTWTGPSKSPV